MADDAENTSAPFLDQSEIDRLLAQETQPQIHTGGVLREGAAALKVEPYDFRNPAFLTETELRRLRLLHEVFIRYLSSRLSLYLRMEFGLKMAQLTTATYAKFTDGLANPTHLSIFKVEPLVGVGILDINRRLALTIADRLLGGKGHSVKAERYLTEIEIALVEDMVMILLDEWCAQWKTEQELSPQIVGHENSGQFLQTSARDAIVLAMTLECNFGDCIEQIQIGIPYFTIEPIVKKMQARQQRETAVVETAKRAEWQASYDRITMPVRAEWDAFEVTLREVTQLRVGDVIEVRPSVCAETRILMNGTPKFIGTVGLDTDRVAVQISRKLPSEEIFNAHSDRRKFS
jgi:flagellar motor switch protein FliM